MWQINSEKLILYIWELIKICNSKKWPEQAGFILLNKETTMCKEFTNASQVPAHAENVKDVQLIPELGRKWQPTPVFLSGEFSLSENAGGL